MGIIFQRTLKCENCGYEYSGKGGGHVIANGEHYGISQYYCSTCHSIIDLEYYLSLRENKEKYIYPDGSEASYDIQKTEVELCIENIRFELTNQKKEIPPLCRECGSHLFKLDIDNDDYAYCPKCGHKSLKQEEIHVTAYIE